jgi:quercetin dioxygenase-like cupin family protein
MRTRTILAFAVSFVLAAAAPAAQGHAKAGTPVFKPAADVKWTDLDPAGAPGVKIADVWGNHASGAFGAFLKFPAGFVAPLHTHTNAIKIVVLSGTYMQTPEGKAEVQLGPGSYAYQPGGTYKHVSACDKASECELFIQSSGKFDLKPVANK